LFLLQRNKPGPNSDFGFGPWITGVVAAGLNLPPLAL
jgi:hypothetical protein